MAQISLAKKYVASIIGQEHIIPTLGVWSRFDDIDFDKLTEISDEKIDELLSEFKDLFQ